MYDIPELGRPFAPRGLRGAALVLDEWAPTHLDAWRGRVLLADGTAARAVVVRHAGDVVGRPPWRGRSGLRAVLETAPPERPLAGIVVEEAGATLVWLPDKEPDLLARELSRAQWRELT